MKIHRVASGEGWEDRLQAAFANAEDGDEVRSCSRPGTVDVNKAMAAAGDKKVTYTQELGWGPYATLPKLREALRPYLAGAQDLRAATADGLEFDGFESYLSPRLAFDFWGDHDGIGVVVLQDGGDWHERATASLQAAPDALGALVITYGPSDDLELEYVAGRPVLLIGVAK